MTSCFFYVLVASNFVVTKTSKSFTNQWIKESIHCPYHYADEIVDTYFSHNLALGDFFLCLVGYAVSDFANFNTIQINEQEFGHFSCWKIYWWPSWGLRWRWDFEAIVCNASYGKSKNIDIFGSLPAICRHFCKKKNCQNAVGAKLTKYIPNTRDGTISKLSQVLKPRVVVYTSKGRSQTPAFPQHPNK